MSHIFSVVNIGIVVANRNPAWDEAARHSQAQHLITYIVIMTCTEEVAESSIVATSSSR